MSRLQKKCLIAAAGTHFLVIVVLLCSAFITSKPKADNSPVLDMIPAKAIDAAFTSGVHDATPPPPTPDLQLPQPPTPQVQPDPPKPDVKPPEPVKQPEAVKPPEPQPDETTGDEPTPKPVKKPHEVTPDLTQKVRKTVPKDNSAAEAEAQAREAAKAAKRAHDAAAKAWQSAARNIKQNASSSTKIALPGTSTAEYANYASIVKSVYMQAWTPPESAANDDANVLVSVTIARDGHITSARIVDRSGDASVDSSVQRALDRVQSIAPFPDSSTDTERTYPIKFNLNAKRMF